MISENIIEKFRIKQNSFVNKCECFDKYLDFVLIYSNLHSLKQRLKSFTKSLTNHEKSIVYQNRLRRVLRSPCRRGIYPARVKACVQLLKISLLLPHQFCASFCYSNSKLRQQKPAWVLPAPKHAYTSTSAHSATLVVCLRIPRIVFFHHAFFSGIVPEVFLFFGFVQRKVPAAALFLLHILCAVKTQSRCSEHDVRSRFSID